MSDAKDIKQKIEKYAPGLMEKFQEGALFLRMELDEYKKISEPKNSDLVKMRFGIGDNQIKEVNFNDLQNRGKITQDDATKEVYKTSDGYTLTVLKQGDNTITITDYPGGTYYEVWKGSERKFQQEVKNEAQATNSNPQAGEKVEEEAPKPSKFSKTRKEITPEDVNSFKDGGKYVITKNDGSIARVMWKKATEGNNFFGSFVDRADPDHIIYAIKKSDSNSLQWEKGNRYEEAFKAVAAAVPDVATSAKTVANAHWTKVDDANGKPPMLVASPDEKNLYKDFEDCKKLQAALAQLGVRSEIQKMNKSGEYFVSVTGDEEIKKAEELLKSNNTNVQRDSNLPSWATASVSGFLSYAVGSTLWKGFTHSAERRKGNAEVFKGQDWAEFKGASETGRDLVYGAMDMASNYGVSVGGVGLALAALTTAATTATVATATVAAAPALITASVLTSTIIGVGYLAAAAGAVGVATKIARMTQEKPLDAIKNNVNRNDVITGSISTGVGYLIAPAAMTATATTLGVAALVVGAGLLIYNSKAIGDSLYNNFVTKPSENWENFKSSLENLRATAAAQRSIHSGFSANSR